MLEVEKAVRCDLHIHRVHSKKETSLYESTVVCVMVTEAILKNGKKLLTVFKFEKYNIELLKAVVCLWVRMTNPELT